MRRGPGAPRTWCPSSRRPGGGCRARGGVADGSSTSTARGASWSIRRRPEASSSVAGYVTTASMRTEPSARRRTAAIGRTAGRRSPSGTATKDRDVPGRGPATTTRSAASRSRAGSRRARPCARRAGPRSPSAAAARRSGDRWLDPAPFVARARKGVPVSSTSRNTRSPLVSRAARASSVPSRTTRRASVASPSDAADPARDPEAPRTPRRPRRRLRRAEARAGRTDR